MMTWYMIIDPNINGGFIPYLSYFYNFYSINFPKTHLDFLIGDACFKPILIIT